LTIAPTRSRFFLGGNDLEMETIRVLLARHVPAAVMDLRLHWGNALASKYADNIAKSLDRGERPVLIELRDDLPAHFERGCLELIDHHGNAAGNTVKTALERVFEYLGLDREHQWTRWFDLVCANDRGHIPGLQQAEATVAEIVTVRLLDRRAQGVTPADEKAARKSIAWRDQLAGYRLAVVRIEHEHASAVADFIHPVFDGPGRENMLVISPREANFDGMGMLIRALDVQFPGGWYGGSLPERGYWGRLLDSTVTTDAIIAFLVTRLAGAPPQGSMASS